MLENWETTQKYESLAWETVMAPAPMASTVYTGSRPSAASSGAMMDEVVMIDTVEEPWAVLMAAAITKGRKIPRCRVERDSPRKVAMGEALRILRNNFV